jgi:hypothetical protein
MGASLFDALAHGIRTSQDVAQQQGQIANQAQQTQNLQTQNIGQQISNQTALLNQRQLQQQAADQSVMRQALIQHPDDPYGWAVHVGGISYPGALNFQQNLLETQKKFTDLSESQQKLYRGQLEDAGNVLYGLKNTITPDMDPQQKEAIWQQALPALQKAEPGNHWAPSYPGDDGLTLYANVHNLTDRIVNQGKVQAETNKDNAQASLFNAGAARDTASIPGIMTEGQQKALTLAGQQAIGIQDQNGWDRLRGSLPAAIAMQMPARYSAEAVKQLQQMGMSPDQQVTTTETARKDLVDEAARQKELSIQGGHLSLDAQRNQREQDIYNQTYGPGANEALVGVDPKLRTQATSAAQKAADEHLKAQAAQQDMKTFLDLAKSGNKEAHAYLSPEGVLTLNTARGVTRVNRQEIEAYANAGNLFDNIAGKVAKLTSGQSVPVSVLKDIEVLHQRIAGNADAAYNAKLQGINQNYHSNFKPIGQGSASSSSAVPDPVKNALKNTPAGIHTLSDGSKWLKTADGSITKQ